MILATLAVIGLLTWPLHGNAQVNGRLALCLNNLRDLTRAWQMYAQDYGYFPPNPDDGNTLIGHQWVPGTAGPGHAQEFDPDLVADPNRSLLMPYVDGGGAVLRCPADTRRGLYRGANAALRGKMFPASRSIAMNQAVGTICPGFDRGTGHNGAPTLASNGPWLDNAHTHRRGQTWRTYGRTSDIVNPIPAQLAVMLDEDPDSINDGSFGLGMVRAEWLDWPATWHDGGGSLSFADGHVELHQWVDERSVVIGGRVSRRPVPGSPDFEWLRERTSARIRP